MPPVIGEGGEPDRGVGRVLDLADGVGSAHLGFDPARAHGVLGLIADSGGIDLEDLFAEAVRLLGDAAFGEFLGDPVCLAR